MGLFSSSNKRSTTNNDNRTINDFSNADLSQDHSKRYEYALDGDNNNNSGTIVTSDHGAIDAALNMADGVAASNAAMANYAIGQNTDLAGHAVDGARGMLGDSLEFADGVTSNALNVSSEALYIADGMAGRGLDASIRLADNAAYQVEQGNNLALALSQVAREQSAETSRALTDGYEQMMQFTEHFSRSDGAAVAETNVKMIGVIVIGLAATALILKRGK